MAVSNRCAGLSVVVVDDHDDGRELVSDVLRLAGASVRDYRDGASALRAIEEVEPDVVVTDLAMSPMDGLELAALLRKHGPGRHPILAITGHAELGAEALGLFDGIVLKPVDVATLPGLVARVARSRAIPPRRAGR